MSMNSCKTILLKFLQKRDASFNEGYGVTSKS